MQEHVSVQTALDAKTEQIAILSGDGAIVAANTAWNDALPDHPAGPRDLMGRPLRDVLSSMHGVDKGAADRILAGIHGVLQGKLPRFVLEYRERGETGARWFLLNATPLTGGRGGALIARSDISAQKAREAELVDRANNDALTGLANRSYFLLEAAHVVALAKRQIWHPALVYLDIDNFKDINDRHGHAVGDMVLESVGARLRRSTRESDLLARLGGDEFAILLSNVKVADSARIVKVYRRSLAQRPIIDGMPIVVQASFGVAHYPVDGVTIEALLSVADQAMYAAKASSARHRRRHGWATANVTAQVEGAVRT